MNLKSGYNLPKYGPSAIVETTPGSVQTQIKSKISQKFNRVVSSPEPGVVLVEPMATDKRLRKVVDASLRQDLLRYVAVTGISHESIVCFEVIYKSYHVLVNPTRSATGKFVGKTQLFAGCVQDVFTASDLKNAEQFSL